MASNKSQISGNDQMVHLTFNETLTNGCFDLDFSEGDADDISMTCDLVTEVYQPPSTDLDGLVSPSQTRYVNI